jgi:hypothetical protein
MNGVSAILKAFKEIEKMAIQILLLLFITQFLLLFPTAVA